MTVIKRVIFVGGLLALTLIVSCIEVHGDDSSLFKFAIHGIIGASMYEQSTPDFFLNGQGPLLLRSDHAVATSGFDVRQTRLNFSVTGPKLFGDATPSGVIEVDFFGLNTPGGYGEVSVLQRLRLAYGEINWGDTWIRFGQDWELLSVNSPVSLGHLAYPATWFAGQLGWREPGFSVFHRIHVTDSSSFEGALQLIKSDWANPYAFGFSTSNDQNLNAGELSGLPGIEARITWKNSCAMVYFAGHWNQVAGSQVNKLIYTQSGDSLTIANRNWNVLAGKVGGKVDFLGFSILGEAYLGKNTAPILGEEATFYSNNDVSEFGGWIQMGYFFNSRLSLWGLFGTARSNLNDVTAAGGGPYSNSVLGGMLQYKVGGFAFGPEIYDVETMTTLLASTQSHSGVMNGMQYMLSGMYFF